MTDDGLRFVQALVRLWDREQRGYTMQEVALAAGWDLADDEDPDAPPSQYSVAAVSAMVDGTVAMHWGPNPDPDGPSPRLLLTPVLG